MDERLEIKILDGISKAAEVIDQLCTCLVTIIDCFKKSFLMKVIQLLQRLFQKKKKRIESICSSNFDPLV